MLFSGGNSIFDPALGFAVASPSDTLRALAVMASSPGFGTAVATSGGGILTGFAAAAALAFALALLCFHSRFAEATVAPFVSLMKSVPIAVVTILLLILFSSSGISFAAVIIASFPILYTSFLSGFRSADEKLLEMAQVFRWGAVRIWRYIRIPAAADHMRSAFVVSSAMAWKAGMAAEVIGAPSGSIGAALHTAKVYLMTDELFAWAIVILILGYVTEVLSVALLDAALRLNRVI